MKKYFFNFVLLCAIFACSNVFCMKEQSITEIRDCNAVNIQSVQGNLVVLGNSTVTIENISGNGVCLVALNDGSINLNNPKFKGSVSMQTGANGSILKRMGLGGRYNQLINSKKQSSTTIINANPALFGLGLLAGGFITYLLMKK